MSDLDELRALIREVIRDLAPHGLPVVETVDLSTDQELAAFVARLLGLSQEQREDIQSGRKRFRLATPDRPGTAPPSRQAGPAARTGTEAGAVRRIERGAVTEAMVAEAARAGDRLLLGRGAVLTPLARDRARASGVEIEKER